MSSKHDRLILIAILAFSVLLRLGVAFFMGDSVPLGKDEQSYSELAARLAGGYGYSFDRGWYPFTPPNTPTAHWSFLYTAFVAAIYSVLGVHPLAARLAGAVLVGILFPLLLYRLSRRVFPLPSASATHHFTFTIHHLSALLAAIYAYFILYSAMVQTEALFICALLWSLERALALEQTLRNGQRVRPWLALTLGISLGVATLLRQSILPWIVVMSLYLLWVGYRNRVLGRAFVALAGAGAVVVLFILPFTIRNYRVYGDFLLLNSNAGYAMYSAQHPMHGTSFQEYAAAPLPDDLVGQGLNEAQWDKELTRRGIGFVLAEPGRYLLLSLSRVRDYFEFWPTPDSSLLFNIGRVLSIGLFLPFMLYGLYLSLRRPSLRNSATPQFRNPAFGIPHSSFFLLYLFIVFYSLLHIFTWAMSRYRLPVDAVLILFAALGLAELWSRVNASRKPLQK